MGFTDDKDKKIDANVDAKNKELIKIASEFYKQSEEYQVEKAKVILKIARIFRTVPVAQRDFSLVHTFNEIITNNDIDRGIAASKIQDIDAHVYLGWKRIRTITENTVKHETILLSVITKNYGNLMEDNNLNTYLIHSKLRKHGINVDKSVLESFVSNGLELSHINKIAIKHLKTSKNATTSLKYIRFRIYTDEMKAIGIKKKIHRDDIQALEECYLLIKAIFDDNERFGNIPRNIIEKFDCLMTVAMNKLNNAESTADFTKEVGILKQQIEEQVRVA